jgi:hypothetical protein
LFLRVVSSHQQQEKSKSHRVHWVGGSIACKCPPQIYTMLYLLIFRLPWYHIVFCDVATVSHCLWFIVTPHTHLLSHIALAYNQQKMQIWWALLSPQPIHSGMASPLLLPLVCHSLAIITVFIPEHDELNPILLFIK